MNLRIMENKSLLPTARERDHENNNKTTFKLTDPVLYRRSRFVWLDVAQGHAQAILARWRQCPAKQSTEGNLPVGMQST